MKTFLLPLFFGCVLSCVCATNAQAKDITYDGYIDSAFGDNTDFHWRVGQPDKIVVHIPDNFNPPDQNPDPSYGQWGQGVGSAFYSPNGDSVYCTPPLGRFDQTHFVRTANTSSGDSIHISGSQNQDDFFLEMHLTDPKGKVLTSDTWATAWTAAGQPSRWSGIYWSVVQGPAYGGYSGYTASVPLVQAEALKVEAKSPVSSGIFHNTAASGGAGTYLNANATGQFVNYSVPVAAGYYNLRVGINTNAQRGIFQLSIDGDKQGKPQDEYSSTAAFGFRDLGRVSFYDNTDPYYSYYPAYSQQNRTFTFTVTGKNASSSGYTLGFDWIDLIPIPTDRLESEWLKVQGISPAPGGYAPAQWFGSFSSTGAREGAGTYFNATTPGQFITYTVPVIRPDIYRIVAGVQTKPNKGKFQLAINGTKQGLVQDEYSPTLTYGERDLGTAYLEPGNQALTFTVTGKNPSSTGYTLAFDYIDVIPSDRDEAESVQIVSKSAVPAGVFTSSEMSGGAGAFFNATTSGQSITYRVPFRSPLNFRGVALGIQTKPNKGKYKISINGEDLQWYDYDTGSYTSVFDGYSPTVGSREIYLGEMGSGWYDLTFTAIDKNPSSSGYTLALDYIRFGPSTN